MVFAAYAGSLDHHRLSDFDVSLEAKGKRLAERMFQAGRVRKLLANTVGPAPWYWQTFPSVDAGNRKLVWSIAEPIAGHGRRVLLCPNGHPDQPVLAVAMYTRVFYLPPGLLGLWFDVGPEIHVVALDPESLDGFELSEPPAATAADYGGFVCRGSPLGKFAVHRNMEQGEHRIDLPLCFSMLDRLLLIGAYARIQEGACAAVYEIRPGVAPGSRRICVYPQKWFTHDGFDLGYQWITRVARDEQTGRLVGDGIRIGQFMLAEDGCHLDRWIE